MIQRRKPLRRKTPIKRVGYTRATAKPMPKISERRKAERRMYNADRAEYLKEHPYCQIFIARHCLHEATVIMGGRASDHMVPKATEIHHRNKTNGPRLLDKRFWMSACASEHEWVENHKNEAREMGLLLPIQANIHGQWGDKRMGLWTPGLMHERSMMKST